MNFKTISTQLLYVTMPIWVKSNNNKENSFGTGFLFNYLTKEKASIPFIVTNFHVINEGHSVITEFLKSKDNEPCRQDKIKVEIGLSRHDIFGNKDNDLYLIPLGPVMHDIRKTGTEIFLRGVDQSMIPDVKVVNELSALEEIIFIGYPEQIYDSKNILPIVRRGITATPIWNDFNDKKKFLIDAGVYPGSSGSPVFIFNQGTYAVKDGIALGDRLLFIGVLSEASISTQEENNKCFLGLGSVIKTEILINFIDSVVKQLKIE